MVTHIAISDFVTVKAEFRWRGAIVVVCKVRRLVPDILHVFVAMISHRSTLQPAGSEFDALASSGV